MRKISKVVALLLVSAIVISGCGSKKEDINIKKSLDTVTEDKTTQVSETEKMIEETTTEEFATEKPKVVEAEADDSLKDNVDDQLDGAADAVAVDNIKYLKLDNLQARPYDELTSFNDDYTFTDSYLYDDSVLVQFVRYGKSDSLADAYTVISGRLGVDEDDINRYESDTRDGYDYYLLDYSSSEDNGEYCLDSVVLTDNETLWMHTQVSLTDANYYKDIINRWNSEVSVCDVDNPKKQLLKGLQSAGDEPEDTWFYGTVGIAQESADNNIIYVTLDKSIIVTADDEEKIAEYGLPKDLDGYDFEMVSIEEEPQYMMMQKDGTTSYLLCVDEVIPSEVSWEDFVNKLIDNIDTGMFVRYKEFDNVIYYIAEDLSS